MYTPVKSKEFASSDAKLINTHPGNVLWNEKKRASSVAKNVDEYVLFNKERGGNAQVINEDF